MFMLVQVLKLCQYEICSFAMNLSKNAIRILIGPIVLVSKECFLSRYKHFIVPRALFRFCQLSLAILIKTLPNTQ